jgi:AcrR family transcriptional regulator
MSSARGRARPKEGPSREEQKLATRARLLRVAERTFTRHGFDGTSVGLVCRTARVTHGALYHHFASKTELFVAVLEQLSRDVASRVAQAAARESGWNQVTAACNAYLDACTEPNVQAIVLRDGPRVLPRERFDRVDHEANEPVVVGLMRGWIAAGLLRPFDVPLVARVLGGAFAEAGAAIAQAENPAEVRGELGQLFATWLEAMRPGG